MLKLILGLFIVFSSALIGLHFSQRLTERKRILQEFSALLKKAEVMISYSAADLCKVFSDNFADYQFIYGEPFDAQWAELVNKYKSLLNDEDISVLTGFAQGIGATDTDNQSLHIGMYISLLDERIGSANRDIEEKSKLYRVLPLSAGLMLAILLI